LEPGYRILKRWKYSHGWNFDRRILDPDGLPVNEWREADIQAVVPIPQRWCRSWSLKGSPAEKIARWISRETGLPMLPTLQPADGPGRGLRQAQRRALDRISQPIRFEIDPDFAPTPGQRILLVDDFMTTGQTLQAAAAALRSHGAASVHAFCLGVRPRRGLSEAKANVFEHESVM
jgi:predicted amidophosphoribosyltransferase